MTDSTTLDASLRTNARSYIAGPVALSALGLTALVGDLTDSLVLGDSVGTLAFALFASGLISTVLLANYTWNVHLTAHAIKSVGWMLMFLIGALTWAVKVGAFDRMLAIVFIALVGLGGLALARLSLPRSRDGPTIS